MIKWRGWGQKFVEQVEVFLTSSTILSIVLKIQGSQSEVQEGEKG